MDGGPRQTEVEPSAPALATAQSLDYAPADRRRKRGRRFRRIAVVVVACVLLVSAWRWGPPAGHRAMALYWQRQCLNQEGPADADAPVYETDPSVVPNLLTGGYTAVARIGRGSGVQFPPGAGYIAPCWRKLLPEIAWTNSYPRGCGEATIFCHRMTSPAGHARLVCVQFEDIPYVLRDGEPVARDRSFYVAVIRPGDWRTPATGSWRLKSSSLIALPPPVYRVYRGRVDPADQSHCSFHFRPDANSNRGVRLDVYLLDDDSVNMSESGEPWPPP